MKTHLLLTALLSLTSIMFCQAVAQKAPSNSDKAIILERSGFSEYQRSPNTELRISHSHISKPSGITHYYFQQWYRGIEIHDAVGSSHINNDGKLIHRTAKFLPNPDLFPQTKKLIDAPKAIIGTLDGKNQNAQMTIKRIELSNNINNSSVYLSPEVSEDEITAKLLYYPQGKELALCWQVTYFDLDEKLYSYIVHGETGKVIDTIKLTVECNFGPCDHSSQPHRTHGHRKDASFMLDSSNADPCYLVYPYPYRSPHDGDRTLEINPHDSASSPYGWHDTNGAPGPEFTTTRGNNAHAYDDSTSPIADPDGGDSLVFSYPLDTTFSTSNPSKEAAITNLFYWTNVMHDMLYPYGFDEAAGNFQENNYGNGGIGGDFCQSEAQDRSGTCNANFATPIDGNSPRMQMFVCGSRDGDLDNEVIVHEYGHGVSIRLTGGAGNSSCLQNLEQMGEGWSDYLGLMSTIKSTDSRNDARGVGAWLFGQGPDGEGIRPHPYTTDMTINPHTYDDIKTEDVPHGVGSVWCAMLWDMTWNLIDEHGFDPDLYYGNGGNNIATQLVIEGMKLQPCSPGFVDGRDAILLADEILYGGQNQCLIWEAFARRGLGYSAVQGSSDNRSDGIEAFDLPPNLNVSKTSSASRVRAGDTLAYTITLWSDLQGCSPSEKNIHISDSLPAQLSFVSASNGGFFDDGKVHFPVIDSLIPGDSVERKIIVTIDSLFIPSEDISDDVEGSDSLWSIQSSHSGTFDWNVTTTNPRSGSQSWFAADVANRTDENIDQYLQLKEAIIPEQTGELRFWHYYDTEEEWDGGVLQYSSDNGESWNDLGDHIIQNGYNSRIDNNTETPAFSGSSGGYIETIVDLSAFQNTAILIRFWMSCDRLIDGDGWYIDDIEVNNIIRPPNILNNTAQITSDSFQLTAYQQPVTEIHCDACIPCDSILNLSGNIADGLYRSRSEILATGQISSPSSVIFEVEQSATLQAEFSVASGASLEITLKNCVGLRPD